MMMSQMAEVLTVRAATPGDCARLLAWRNAPAVRAASLNTNEINETEHKVWYVEALKDPNIIVFIAEMGNHAVGMIRFNRNADHGRISILLDPRFHGRGLAKPMLKKAIAATDDIANFTAEVRADNMPSLALFHSCGFSESHVDGLHTFKLSRKDMK